MLIIWHAKNKPLPLSPVFELWPKHITKLCKHKSGFPLARGYHYQKSVSAQSLKTSSKDVADDGGSNDDGDDGGCGDGDGDNDDDDDA